MSYCNTGFSLLGRVIEVATGEVFDAAIRTRLFEPLGLTHTATLPEDVLRFRAAIGHIEPPGRDQTTAPAWGLPRTAGPAGGICSTPADVLRFAQLHLHGGEGIVSGDSVRAMQEQQVVVPERRRRDLVPLLGARLVDLRVGRAHRDWPRRRHDRPDGVPARRARRRALRSSC